MKNIIYILGLMLFCGCANWQYKDIGYERCQYLESVHVHFYNHQTCEWSCLNMDKGYYTYEDVVRIKYKTDEQGKIKKIKLIK